MGRNIFDIEDFKNKIKSLKNFDKESAQSKNARDSLRK